MAGAARFRGWLHQRTRVVASNHRQATCAEAAHLGCACAQAGQRGACIYIPIPMVHSPAHKNAWHGRSQHACPSARARMFAGVCRACYGVLRFVMESGAKGCEVIVSGKLRAARAKSMKFKDGYMVSSGQPARVFIDAAVRHVLLRQGVLGIKVGGAGGGGCQGVLGIKVGGGCHASGFARQRWGRAAALPLSSTPRRHPCIHHACMQAGLLLAAPHTSCRCPWPVPTHSPAPRP